MQGIQVKSSNKICILWKTLSKWKLSFIIPNDLTLNSLKVTHKFILQSCVLLTLIKVEKSYGKTLFKLVIQLNHHNQLVVTFNMLTSTNEKSGGLPPNLKQIDEFIEWILQANLLNVIYIGNKFTCRRRRTHELLHKVLFNAT